MPGDAPWSSRQVAASADPLVDFTARLRSLPSHEWVDEVRRDQANRWRSGQRILLEDYFQCCPELTQNEENTLVLIVGEAIPESNLGGLPAAFSSLGRAHSPSASIGSVVAQ
jgi:hypothetical protein